MTFNRWLYSTIQVTERYAHLNRDKLVHTANMLELLKVNDIMCFMFSFWYTMWYTSYQEILLLG